MERAVDARGIAIRNFAIRLVYVERYPIHMTSALYSIDEK